VAPAFSGWRDDAVVRGRQLAAAAQSQLLEDAGQVDLDRGLTDRQAVCQ